MQRDLPTFRKSLLRWYDANRRDLPWRTPRNPPPNGTPTSAVDPYHVLVSELMLQQTQVATVIPYFHRFIERFPTPAALADADEQDVLRLWQGLGYYSRARNLHRAAKAIVHDHAGVMPRTVDALLALPGVGRYTAGAIASIAFDRRAPILDGNVIRVLCRLDKIQSDPRDRATQEVLWARAEEILPRKRLGDFNSALMELGALVCAPRSPQCLICPVRAHCDAFAAGLQERIPAPKKSKPTPLLHRCTFCIRHANRYLIEQRPPKGRWANLWQFPTTESPQNVTPDNATAVTTAATSLHPSLAVSHLHYLGTVTHALTHRRYEFTAYTCDATDAGSPLPHQRWITLADLKDYPLSRPQLQIAALLSSLHL